MTHVLFYYIRVSLHLNLEGTYAGDWSKKLFQTQISPQLYGELLKNFVEIHGPETMSPKVF